MNKLTYWRSHRFLTMRGLAEKSGVSLSTIVVLENGQRKAYPLTLSKLSKALDVPIEEFYDLLETRKPDATNS